MRCYGNSALFSWKIVTKCNIVSTTIYVYISHPYLTSSAEEHCNKHHKNPHPKPTITQSLTNTSKEILPLPHHLGALLIKLSAQLTYIVSITCSFNSVQCSIIARVVLLRGAFEVEFWLACVNTASVTYLRAPCHCTDLDE